MKVYSVQDTITELFLRMWNPDKPFYYTRYGDGDFEIMLGRSEMQHSADPDLARELLQLFHNQSPEHMLAVALHDNEPGMADGLFKAWTNPDYYTFVEKNSPPDACFYNAIALHYTAVFDPLHLRDLLKHIRARLRSRYFVGNAPIDPVQHLTGPLNGYVQSPYTNAYKKIDMLYEKLRVQLDRDALTRVGLPIILMACGMTSRALTNRLLLDKVPAHVIDLGSLVDFAIGNANRTWIRMAGTHQLPIILEDNDSRN